MQNIPVADVRNFALLGHAGSGKTTLTDALLLKLGLNDRLGLVDAGSSLSDFTDEEKSRKLSILAKPFTASYKTSGGKTIGLVFTDTPGYQDFFGQVVAAARAAETGLIVVDAGAGVQVGTRNAWKACGRRGLSKAFVITGLDRDNTDFSKTLDEIKSTFGSNCVPVTLPLPDGSGVVDVLAGGDASGDIAAQVEEIKGGLVELAAETDDALMEKYFEEGDLPADEIAKGLVDSVANGAMVPVFVCMPLKGMGITELLEGVARLFPSPAARVVKDAEDNVVPSGADAPFAGLVWRTVNDPFVGQLNFVRVLAGTLKGDSEVFNATKGEKERIGALLVVNGKKQDTVTEAAVGDIVAIPKLKVTGVGDSLCAAGQKTVFAPIAFPRPVFFQSVTAKTQADEDKIGTALARVADEDPTLRLDRNPETREQVLAGLGDVQIDVAVGMMKSRSNVEVVLGTPRLPYRETVTAMGEGHYKHKKQSGGRGQYGEVYLRVEPKAPDEEDWFVNAVVGGVIPGNFIPAVQKGLVEGLAKGALAGFPVTDVKATVYDGSYHDVDSSEIAFKIAAARAFRDGMDKAKPVLLEPIMTVKIMIPDTYMGDITGDLNQRRGRILGMGTEDGLQVVTGEAPQAELFRYAAELRSMTAGQGTFEMDFARYEQVPANIAQKVIDATKKEEEEA